MYHIFFIHSFVYAKVYFLKKPTGNFQLLFLLKLFSPIFLLSWVFNDSNIIYFVKAPQILEALLFGLFYFLSLFSLFFRLGNFYCSVFKFTDSSVLFILLLPIN